MSNLIRSWLAACCVVSVAAAGDSPVSFQAPQALNSRAATDTGDDSSAQLARTANGWLAVWSAPGVLGNSGADQDIAFARSTDGGRTWSDQAVLNTNATVDNGDDSRPRIAVDGATVVVVWQSDSILDGIGSGDLNILAASSANGGQSWSDPVLVNGESSGIDGVPDLNPDVATDGRGIFMTVWESEDRLDGTVGTRINVVFSVSLDRGANWSEPALAALNTVDDIDFDLRPRIAADARNWVVVWQSADDLQGTIREDRDILATTSSDARRWSAPIPVNTTADIDDEPDLEPEIATDTAGTWMVVWTSEHDLGGRIGMDRDVLAASSVDGGRTWTAPVPANTSAFTDEHSDEQADVASNGTGAWIAVWVTTENIEQRLGMDGDAVFALSTNAGANWTAPDVLNTDADVDNEADAEPHIAAALNGPWIGTWSSRETVGGATGGDADVLFSSSTLDVPGAAPPACGGMEPAFLILAVGLVSRRLRPGSPWRKCSAVGSAAGRSSGAGS